MRLPLLHREPPPALPGVTGQVRLDPSTRAVLRRVRPGDVALLDEVDLGQVMAEALLAARVGAVVNVAPSISGRYPAQGARVLLEAGVPVLDAVGPDVVGRVSDGDLVRVDGEQMFVGQRVVAEGVVLTSEGVATALEEARSGLRAQLEGFVGSAPEFLRTELQLLLEGQGVPEVPTLFEGRPALVVVRGPRDVADLASVDAWIQDQDPALVGVGAGADVLLSAGYHPDLVLGDMDEVSDEVLDGDVDVVVHALRDGRVPGLDRARQHHRSPVVFTSDAADEDLAVLLAVHHGASLVVLAGSADGLVELLDHDRAAVPSAVLTRLRAGDRLVDARSVALLHRREVSWVQVLLLLVAGILAVATALVLLLTPFGQDWWNRLGGS